MLKKIYQIYKRVCTILSQIAASPQPPIPPSNSLTPTGCPMFHLNTDTTHLVVGGLANLALNKQKCQI